MKYKCIEDYHINNTKVMSKGDIIEIGEDKTQIYNITKHLDIKNTHQDNIINKLVNMTDNCKESNNCSTKHPFVEITDDMFKTYLRKNKDYGNSFDQSLDKWGLSVAAIRLGDKLNRFESFVKNGTFAVNDEGVRDTLMDLATYSIMTIMYLNGKA